MVFSRAYTIIVATLNSVARIDLQTGKSIRVVRAQSRPRSAQSALADAVASGLCLGPTRCGRLYVLSDELFFGHVALDDQIVAAIDPQKLEQTLALESEYASGLSPFASRLAYVISSQGDGQTIYGVTQIEISQLDELSAALPSWAGPLDGIAAIEPIDSVVGIHDPQSSASWDVARCQSLAVQWLTQTLDAGGQYPLISLKSQRWDERHQQQLAIAGAVATIVLCTALHVWNSRQLSAANDSWAKLQQQETQLRDTLDQQERIARVAAKQAAEREERRQADAARIQQRRQQAAQVDALRRRPAELLQALADTADPGHWIQNIDFGTQQVVVVGVAIDSIAITNLTQRLENRLPSSRWRIQPAQMSVAAPTALVRFELTLVPHSEPAPPINVADRGGVDVL